jgi:hypothetical protein
MLDLSDGDVLFAARSGLFVAHAQKEQINVDRVGKIEIAKINGLNNIVRLGRGGVAVIGTDNGLVIARKVNGVVTADAVKGETGSVTNLVELPTGAVLVESEKGVFVVRLVNGEVTVDLVNDNQTQTGSSQVSLPDGEVLIRSNSDMYVATAVSGNIRVQPVQPWKEDLGITTNLTDGGTLIGSDQGVLIARIQNDAITVRLASDTETGAVHSMLDLPDGGILIGAENGLFLARVEHGVITINRAPNSDTGPVNTLRNLHGGWVLVYSNNGSFIARTANGELDVKPAVDSTKTGYFLTKSADLPDGDALIWAEKGLFEPRDVNGALIFDFVGGVDTGQVTETFVLFDNDLLISATKGLFIAHITDDAITVYRAHNAEAGSVREIRDLSNGDVLLVAEKGLFVARKGKEAVAIDQLDSSEIRNVDGIFDLDAGQMLVDADKGFFVLRVVNGAERLNRISDLDILWRDVFRIPGGGLLFVTDNELFVAHIENDEASFVKVGGELRGQYVYKTLNWPGDAKVLLNTSGGLFVSILRPLLDARVKIPDRKNLDGSVTDPKRALSVTFTINHPCASIADKLDLKVRVTAPNRKPVEIPEQSVVPGSSIAELTIPLRIDTAGQWLFQLISTANGMERAVGDVQKLDFVSSSTVESIVQQWWKVLGVSLGILLALANTTLFAIARYSPQAWRLATDDGWATWSLRFAILLLSHFPKAQLWIIDLYFRHVRSSLREPRPFLPLPLTTTGRFELSTEALAPPWKGQRLWVQGGSGMGKTALFRNIAESHFRDHETAFAAYAKWRCILVPFAARDFAGSGEDKDDPAWVVDAVRATLSSEGLTFASDTLLTRFLESGTIAVAIDGLNEVDRTRAVAAFSRMFSEAPMLVTSQQPGNDRFTTWRLPTDIRDFTSDLLRLYLTPELSEAVIKRISASGLKDTLRSGYDVRLIIDLARADLHLRSLPDDRMGLYAAVIEAGWPDVAVDARREQQNLTAAAAWRMVSERKPNEDIRRLKADIDLPADLLTALADAPEKDNRPVRLIRRVGGNGFEFVHDQMHSYLAARWFTQAGLSVGELERMVAGSTIWTQAPDARRTLWGFVAALLDNERLIALWRSIVDKEDWDVLRRALKNEAERRGLPEAREVELEPS